MTIRPKRSRKGQTAYPEDQPLVVKPLDMEEVITWRGRADMLREQGLTYREIAKEVGRGYSSVQRHFLNEDRRREVKMQQNEYDRRRRAEDPEYAEKQQNYRRRYMKLRRNFWEQEVQS